jgi:hypothetical protein
MTDVIRIAKERRTRLQTEVAKLDDFIRMAEALVEWSQTKSGRTNELDVERPGTSSSSSSSTSSTSSTSDTSTIRPYPAAAEAKG